jgi:nucleotide-binding universal stress UspA family protein
MKILIGYDGTSTAEDALMLCKVHAKAFDAETHVVISLEGGTKTPLEEIEKAKTDLEYAGNQLKDEGIRYETHLLIRGMTPGEDIVEFAKEKNIDEIIVGVRKRSKVGKFLLGSTAQHVILEAHCPVLTVK